MMSRLEKMVVLLENLEGCGPEMLTSQKFICVEIPAVGKPWPEN